MAVSQPFYNSRNLSLIHELVTVVRDYCDFFQDGHPCFRNLVAWNFVDKCVCKWFNGTWYTGTVHSYKLQREWFEVKSSDGLEDYSSSDLALIYYSELHPSAFFLAVDLVMLVMVALHAGSFCSPFFFSPGADSFDPAMCFLIEQAAYSITALDNCVL